MPKRSSTKRAKRDFSQVAFDLVAKLTGEKSKPEDKRQESLSAALDDDTLRKQVMREMGSRGGKKGGKARAEKLSQGERSEIAKEAAKARWGVK